MLTLKGKGIRRKIRMLINLTTNAPIRYLKASLYKHQSHKIKFPEQKLFSFTIDSKAPGIKEFLNEKSIPYNSGKFCLTITDYDGLKKFSEGIFNFYSSLFLKPFCLKVYLSQNFINENDAYYVFDTDTEQTGMEAAIKNFSIKSHGTIQDTVSTSNILSLSQITPRVYDTFVLKLFSKKYITQIVESFPQKSDPEVSQKLIQKIKEVFKDEEIAITGPSHPWENKDFMPPDYGNNIGSNGSESRYVDIQKFIFRNRAGNINRLIPEIKDKSHFGDEHKSLGGRYNYQSIPFLGEYGKRKIELRMEQMSGIYEKFGFDIKEKTILDVGCNMAGFGMQYLARGAKWYLGLDKPELTEVARKLLYYLNYSRFDLFGLNLNKDNPLTFLNKYGKIDLILFLSMQKHIGIPGWLNEMDFNYMFYEGHQNEPHKLHEELLMKSLVCNEIHYVGESYDGETRRPLFFCIKQNPRHNL